MQMADLRLDRKDLAFESGESGGTIEVGSAEDSLFIQRLTDNDLGLTMPPTGQLSKEEIKLLSDWVDQGGSLLLIADHMPMPGAVEELAAAFDLIFHNGFLYDAEGNSKLDFTRGAGLAEHPVTTGRHERERVDKVRTFTGQAFRATREIEPLLSVPDGSKLRLPIEAWEFEANTPSIPADGLLQGAVFHFGRGSP